MKRSSVKACLILFSLLVPVIIQAQRAIMEEVATGVWKVSAGRPHKHDLFKAADTRSADEALKKMGASPLPIRTEDIVIEVVNDHTNVRFPLRPDEELFGLGLNFKSIHMRGRIFQLHVDHYGGSDNGRTHAPVPFYVSSEGYGVFVNSSRYLTVYAGTAVRKDSPEAPQERDRVTDKDWSAQPYSDAVEIPVPERPSIMRREPTHGGK